MNAQSSTSSPSPAKHAPVHPVPKPWSTERAENAWTDFEDAARAAGLDDVVRTALEATNRARLDAIFGNSPYLTRTIIKDPAFVARLLTTDAETLYGEIMDALASSAPEITDTDALMAALRKAKAQIALVIAAADIWSLWPLETVTGTLSQFAELSLDLAVSHLLRAGMIKGDLAPPDGVDDPASLPANPELGRKTGFIVLGMGKLGGYELNYSSDIDLILMFDNDVVRYTGRKEPQQFFVRLARDLVRVMQERTGDGYVFRTDLRLRPDPGATPLALSVDAAEIYYQSIGLNWERAAMIKARAVAGDHEAAAGFLERIRGFVWRKHLDFAAIDDIHAIKNQIHSHHRHGDIKVAGQDIKLGRGGIREIEFFASIHQLIAGGREYDLRVAPTLKALAALETLERISPEDRQDLSDAYHFFRRVEHRLQMINDDQTHEIPENEEDVAHLATFMGFETADDFGAELLAHLGRVKTHYDELLEHPGGGEAVSDDDPELSLPGDITSPEMAATLTRLGYMETDRMCAIIEGWQFGRYRALRTRRSRDLLVGIMPRLLSSFADTADPDVALIRFDDFLSKLPSGVQILSLFQANPWLLDVVADIMGIAPALAEQLARRPLLLDAVISPDFFQPIGSFETLRADLAEAVSHAHYYEEVLDLTRIWANEQKFQVGVQCLRAAIESREAGRALADVADAVLSVLLHEVSTEFAKRHGHVPGSHFTVIGMGKLGGREMTSSSDLDLVFLYDLEDPDVVSDGQKSLTPGHFFTRLAQTYINAITAPTSEGTLYEVDMRLRPSGNAGPLAVSREAFEQYQRDKAWTWEHMALTRARFCAGDDDLGEKVMDAVRGIIATGRDDDDLRHNVADMRERLRREFGTDNIWSVKHCRGGLVDMEFVCQYLVLRHTADNPQILTPGTLDTIERLSEAGYLDSDDANTLGRSYRLLSTVQALLRLCVGKGFDADSASTGLKATLIKATGHDSFDALKSDLEDCQKAVSALHARIVGSPRPDDDTANDKGDTQ